MKTISEVILTPQPEREHQAASSQASPNRFER